MPFRGFQWAGLLSPEAVFRAPTLQERLGYKRDARLLIINADDMGMCLSEIDGTLDAMKKGVVTDATIMVPCPWFSRMAEVARENPKLNFGIHLTLNAEWRTYKWRPVLPADQVPSLVDENGYLLLDWPDVVKRVAVDDAVREWRAQIQRALDAGIDVTHIDAHMGCYQRRQDLFDAARKLALEFRLPMRVVFVLRKWVMRRRGLPVQDGFYMKSDSNYEKHLGDNLAYIAKLKPGVHELGIHTARESAELRKITNAWRGRVNDRRFAMDPRTREAIKKRRVQLVSWRDLRDVMRGERK